MAQPSVPTPAPRRGAELRSCARLALPGARALDWLVPRTVPPQWLRRPQLSLLPSAPAQLAGVMYWRGGVVPVFDTLRWLDPAQAPRTCADVLVLALAPAPAAFLIEGEPRLRSVTPAVAPPAADAAPPPLVALLTAGSDDTGAAVYEIELNAWLAQLRTTGAPVARLDHLESR